MSPSSTAAAASDELATRPLRRDAAENRERLLEAAKKVFASYGLDAGVEDIAREAGVGMGTLYRRFPTKEALIAELVRDVTEEVRDVAEECLSREDGSGLAAFLVAAGELQASNLGLLKRLWHDAISPTLLNELRELVALLLADAQARRAIRTDATPQDITVTLWAVRGVIETTGQIAPDAWRRHLEIVLRGLRPPGYLPAGADLLTSLPLTRRQAERISASREQA